MLTNPTVTKLHEMRLSAMASAFKKQLEDAAMSFLVCKHRHSGVAETANPGSGNRESGNAETAIAVMSYGCRI